MSVTLKKKSMRSKSRKLGKQSKKGMKRKLKLNKTRKMMRGGVAPPKPPKPQHLKIGKMPSVAAPRMNMSHPVLKANTRPSQSQRHSKPLPPPPSSPTVPPTLSQQPVPHPLSFYKPPPTPPPTPPQSPPPLVRVLPIEATHGIALPRPLQKTETPYIPYNPVNVYNIPDSSKNIKLQLPQVYNTFNSVRKQKAEENFETLRSALNPQPNLRQQSIYTALSQPLPLNKT